MPGYWDVTFNFDYFNQQLRDPEWETMKVLDFGGSIGNMLPMSGGRIRPENYWCLDVNAAAIREGQRLHPEAHFVHYDRYNYSFNPAGTPALPIPEMGLRFDLIISHSVFTHTSPSEMLATVMELMDHLKPGGQLAFTFIEAEYNAAKTNPGYQDVTNLELRFRQLNGKPMPQLVEQYFARDPEWCLLLNEADLYYESEAFREYDFSNKNTIFSFFKPRFVHSLFPGARIQPPPAQVYPPDYIAEQQHVCILENVNEA